jgi:hypothetical protein
VAERCAGAPIDQETGLLGALVTDLFLSGVDPSHATEALILGDCAPLDAIVSEMVAQGGEAVTTEVVERALRLGGPGSEPIIESAAAAGLERGSGVVAAGSGGAGDGGSSYGMAYFPSRAAAAGLQRAGAINPLYGNATPGYAIYTFVLLGAAADEPKSSPSGGDPSKASGAGRLQELLRVIESYVLGGDEASRAPNAVTHAFLIAVHPERADADLAGQTGPELSTPIRRDFARYLRSSGSAALAARLETNPGPFLVSSLEPRLLPSGALSPRLVTDLSDVGGEYMYAIVDAYDRPVPGHLAGRPESLDGIREHLIGLFPRQAPGPDLDASVADAWVFRVGARSSIASGEAPPGGPAAGPSQDGGQRLQGEGQREPSIGHQSPRVRGT